MSFLTCQIGKDQRACQPTLRLMFFGAQAWILFSFLVLKVAFACGQSTQ